MKRSIFPTSLVFSWVLWLGFCSQLAFGSPDEVANLEERVWTVSPEHLQDLESRVARLIQVDPKSSYGHYLLAQLYLRQFKENPTHLKLLKQASELGQQAMELSPREDHGFLIAAQVLDLMGYPENSLDILQTEKGAPRSISWRTPFISGLLQAGNRWEVSPTAQFEQSLKFADANPNIVLPEVIKVLRSNYSGENLVQELKKWNAQYENQWLALSLGEAYAQMGSYSEAHKTYLEIQRRYPMFDDAFVLDGVLLYTHMGQPQKAEGTFVNLLKGKPALSLNRHPIVNAHLGRIMLESKKYGESERYFFDAIVSGHQSMEWLNFAHKSYERSQRLQDFAKLLERLSHKIPGTGYLYALQGEVLSEGLAMHDKAIESFNAAILLDPERTEFHNGLGLTYYRMARYHDALGSFLKATNIDPQDATSRYNQACVLSLLGRTKEALGSLREAIGLDPRLQQTARNDKDFVSLREMPTFQMLTEPRSSASTQVP